VGTRRTILKAVATAALASGAASEAAAQAPKGRIRRIATEEGFSIPELLAATNKYFEGPHDEPGQAAVRAAGYNPRSFPQWPQQLMSLDERRISDMDAAGIDAAIIMVGSPGVQVFEAQQGTELSKLVNDRAAAAAKRFPGRLYPLAALAPQDPEAAAQEFERAVKTLGMKGAIINSSTKGHYLDEQRYWPILEAAVAMDVPIYIHPREPSPQMIGPYLSPAMLASATWGFAAETGLHAVRLIMEGVFDQFPRLRIIVGHGGEAVPFFMDRLDVRYREETVKTRRKLKRLPSEYFKTNFDITSSGLNWAPAIKFCQEVLGPEKVMFAADYPFENAPEAVRTAELTQMSANDRALFFHKNAERVFKL
jgi:5-carboxyvanillate decarboxylase